jgi:hypothetical protein
LFDNNSLNWKLEDGTRVRLDQSTKYPWDGKVALTVSPAAAKDFTLYVRRIASAQSVRVAVDGLPVAAPKVEKGYIALRRTWKPGAKVTLQFDITPRLVASNEMVRDNIGKNAVERGPLVYCMESLDQPASSSVFDWTLDSSAAAALFKSEWKPDLLGGIVTLSHSATRPVEPYEKQPLYQSVSPNPPRSVAGQVTLIPYYTFHNREITAMQVWIPTDARGAVQ